MMWVYAAICVLCWGAWGFVEKLGSQHMSPLAMQLVNGYMWSAITPILFLYMRTAHVDTTMNIWGVTWSIVATFLSFGAVTAFISCLGMPGIPAAVFVGITSTYPVVTYILCVLFLDETVTFVKTVALVVVCLGVYMLAI